MTGVSRHILETLRDRGSMRSAEIAVHACAKHPSVRSQLSRMHEMGLVERAWAAGLARVAVWSITEAGRDRLEGKDKPRPRQVDRETIGDHWKRSAAEGSCRLLEALRRERMPLPEMARRHG